MRVANKLLGEMAIGKQSRPSVAFIYLGRRGPLGQFTLQLAQAAAQLDDYNFDFIISSNNELADDFEKQGLAVTKIDNMLTGRFMSRPNWTRIYDLMAILVLAGAVALAVVIGLDHVGRPQRCNRHEDRLHAFEAGMACSIASMLRARSGTLSINVPSRSKSARRGRSKGISGSQVGR